MAFLVCYSWTAPDDHTCHKAIYLDHRFYELIYDRCRSVVEPYFVMRKIAMLKYKSPTMVVEGERLELLSQDLTRLAESRASHP